MNEKNNKIRNLNYKDICLKKLIIFFNNIYFKN